jgi:general secretion pathway protein A
MSSRLRFGTTALLLLTAIAAVEGRPVWAKEAKSDAGIALQTILETEQTARLLAILLDSGRSVINDQQALFDEPGPSDKGKGLTPDVFDRQLTEMFRSRSGTDLQDLDASRVPAQAKKLLKELVAVSRHVVADAQPEINRSSGPRGLLPAIFGARVAGRFTERTGVRMKQTTLLPRNAANAPDSTERSALELFADPGYPREKPISETTAKSGALRLMFPLYATRHCLNCHGEPKGALDRTGYPREGWKLGQNAGAISVIIPIAK